MSPSETIAYHQANDPAYSSREFLDKDQEYEMVKTDDDQTWVNCWLDWKGTLAGNGKEVEIPIDVDSLAIIKDYFSKITVRIILLLFIYQNIFS